MVFKPWTKQDGRIIDMIQSNQSVNIEASTLDIINIVRKIQEGRKEAEMDD